jgi:hypothetical protein
MISILLCHCAQQILLDSWLPLVKRRHFHLARILEADGPVEGLHNKADLSQHHPLPPPLHPPQAGSRAIGF